MALLVEEYFRRGVENIEKGLWEESIADWTAVIHIEPEKSGAYFNRGFAKHKLGQNEAAISDFDRAIQLNPTDAEAYFIRGVIQSELEEYVKALSDLNQAICLDPSHSQAYGSRGLVKSRLAYYKSAIDDYSQAISIDPKDAVSYSNRADAKSNLNDISGALSDCNKAIEIDPSLKIAYFNRGFIYAKLGNYAKAIADYSHAILLDPKYAAAYSDRGTAQFNLDNYEMAISDCTQAVSIDPNYAEPYFIRGISYQLTANFYEAQLDINRFLCLASSTVFFKNPIPIFDFCQYDPAPYLLHRTLQKFTENFEQFNTVHPIVDATQQQCRPWKIWEEWRRLACSEKHKALAHYHALALVNHYMGDPIEAFRIYKEVLDDEDAMDVPLNLMGLYYYIESAKLFREEYGILLEDAIEQIEETQTELIKKNALCELYYAGQILWANDQPGAAHEYFELADDYLPAAYMQMLSLPVIGADTDEIETKVANIRERESTLPPEEGFLQGFPARPFRLEKPGEDFFAPILHYAHYREIAEALAEVRQPGEPFEHLELWKAFYWLPENEREIEWLQRREQLAELNRALLEKFRGNVQAGQGVHELSLLEQAFADKLSHDLWEGTKYLGFEDFKQKSMAWPDAVKDMAALIRTSHRLDYNDKMLLVEYCFLRDSISIEDTFLLYFYIDFVKHPLPIEAAEEGFGEAGQELVKLIVAPDTIFGQLLTAFGGGAAVCLFGDFWAARQQEDHINMDDYSVSATQPTAAPDDFDLFVDNFLRFMSYQRETLGAEKFEERYPLEGFEDWKRKSK